MQGIRPQGLQRVTCRELQTVISLCISPRAERPRARQLLKHPYFDTIRQEKVSVKLSVDALAASGSAHSELAAEIAGELSTGLDFSRCSSAAASAAAGDVKALLLLRYIILDRPCLLQAGELHVNMQHEAALVA